LPPIQQGSELYSLDSAGNSETEEQPVEMSLHCSTRHVELARDFRIVTTLQKQFDDLLLAWAKPNGLIFHSGPPSFLETPSPVIGAAELSRIHSIHDAILRRKLAVTVKQLISTGTCRQLLNLRETGFTVQKSAPTLGLSASALSVSVESRVKSGKIEATAR